MGSTTDNGGGGGGATATEGAGGAGEEGGTTEGAGALAGVGAGTGLAAGAGGIAFRTGTRRALAEGRGLAGTTAGSGAGLAGGAGMDAGTGAQAGGGGAGAPLPPRLDGQPSTRAKPTLPSRTLTAACGRCRTLGRIRKKCPSLTCPELGGIHLSLPDPKPQPPSGSGGSRPLNMIFMSSIVWPGFNFSATALLLTYACNFSILPCTMLETAVVPAAGPGRRPAALLQVLLTGIKSPFCHR